MSSISRLPEAFAPLEEERTRIDRILERLETSTDLWERADLASELVRSASRYEDTLERAVWPLDSRDDTILANAREELRDTMQKIHVRTSHVDARNVHAPDPQGFENELGQMMQQLTALLAREDEQLAVLDANLTPGHEPLDVAGHVARILRTASERPRAPRTALGRALSNATVKLDHNFEDASTPQHPAKPTAG